MNKLPDELVTLIYRACCGTCTPEQAQKEPCLCDAAAIIEQIEEWHEAEVNSIDAVFEELAPPDVPRSIFARWCFDAWERESEAHGDKLTVKICSDAIVEIERLRAIVDKLPKTADGVPIVLGSNQIVWVWTLRKGLYRPKEGPGWHPAHTRIYQHDSKLLTVMVEGSHVEAFRPNECYSTREAAEAGRE